MYRLTQTCAAALMIAAIALTGCAQKTDEMTETSADSLLSSSPIEQPEGDITPQTDYTEPAETPPAPAATTPRRTTPRSSTPRASSPAADQGVTLAAGTPIDVSVAMQISSETAKAGDTWTGEVRENVIVGDKVVIPAGSQVTGVVSAVTAAEKGDRASLDLAVKSVSVNGRNVSVSAGTEAIVAGSTRARNLGAIVGGTAAGALVGKAVGGSKGALIGGLIGGAATTGAVAKSKGYQVVLKEGTVLTFNVSEATRVRT